MIIKLPCNVNTIIASLVSYGHEAYIVGGCVRDCIMGKTPKDWDITTSALPADIINIFPKTIETGIKHGTVTVMIKGQSYEITTYRIDGKYLDNRRPETVTFTPNIQEDLSRRDFTMNAIAYNPTTGFVDPYKGQEDISQEIIRCVGNPVHRFKEDALRMLRAIRFCGQLGFSVESTILEAISQLRQNLVNISAERIREELTRLLIGPNLKALHLLESTGLLPYITMGYPYMGNIAEAIDLMTNCPSNEHLRMVVFFDKGGLQSTKMLQALRYSNKTTNEISQYISMLHTPIPHDRYEIKKYLRQMPQSQFENLLTLQSIFYPKDKERLVAILKESQDIQDKKECYTIKDLTINGRDLINAGICPGKDIGDKLDELLEMVMRNPSLNESLREHL